MFVVGATLLIKFSVVICAICLFEVPISVVENGKRISFLLPKRKIVFGRETAIKLNVLRLKLEVKNIQKDSVFQGSGRRIA